MPSYATHIPASELESRSIAAEFYSPHFVESARTLHRAPGKVTTLGKLVVAPINNSIRAVTHVLGVDGATVPMFRPADMDGWWVSELTAPKLPADFEADHVKSRVHAGDIVLAIAGTIAKVGRVPPGVQRGAINGSCARIRLQGSLATYGLAFLNSRYGRAGLERLAVGSVQKHLNLVDLPSVPFLVPDRRIQDYIGAKVELAERCRARSGYLRAEAIARFDALLRTPEFSPGSSLTNVVDARALTDRLTGEFYLPRYFALEAHLAGLGVPVKPLRSLLRSEITRSSTPERDEAAPVPCILTSDIDPHEIRWRSPSLRITQSVHDRHSGRLAARDVVYTSVGPPVGEAAVVLPQFLPMAVGGDVSILRHGADLHPGFLALYLNSAFGQMQNDRYSRGIRQRRVYPEDIGAFLIPEFGAKVQAYVGERIVLHQVLNELAVDLVKEAKADVEALIEGSLDVQAILAGALKAPTADDIPELAEDAG